MSTKNYYGRIIDYIFEIIFITFIIIALYFVIIANTGMHLFLSILFLILMVEIFVRESKLIRKFRNKF